MISNAGQRFQRTFADEPLLERLRIAATDSTTDPDVKAKLKVLFAQWAREYKDTQGLQGITNLYKQFPRRGRPAVTKPAPAANSQPPSGLSRSPPTSSSPSSSARVAGDSDGGGGGGSGGGWRSSHKKTALKSKHQSFNLEKEKPALNLALANASITSTNLLNALKLINREKERASQKHETVRLYESCKSLRSDILRFIQHVESEQWLGSLIHAHEELSAAMELYENYDKPVEEDSDSDDDWNLVASSDAIPDSASPPPAMPPRPKGKIDRKSVV